MSNQLTKSEAYAVLQVLELGADYRRLAKPLQWHQLMLHWNWDGNLEPLWWIIQQPFSKLHSCCDILLIPLIGMNLRWIG